MFLFGGVALFFYSGRRYGGSARPFADRPANFIHPNTRSPALAALTRWNLNRENSVDELNHTKDNRFAARMRGSLAVLREEFGDEAVLLVPIQQAWRKSMLEALERLPHAESSSPVMASDEEEE